ncbi:glycosyltransferase [Bacillus sp. ISL-47]|uniref:glycosyltransferase n=1 Tax=Bacillus sp. ISL-47 TaxID=2819130 RepID=UPI001BECB94F|nr:glycosyltransferase family 2 protein [Bacillus sp. ISL-47]MBT2686997.1 glycosyltransferase [Bacillus sp. ISL-47]
MFTLLLSLSLLVWLAVFMDASFGFNRLDRLEDAESTSVGPRLSVIVAARNEEARLEQSLKSQLEQSYKRIEWILVNDRSADKTGEIMDWMQESDSRIRTIHIDSLPDGWLGKNHALYKGYCESTGELILFTDADVLFKKEAISKAIHYFNHHKLDHLTAAPNLNGKSFWLKAFIAFFLFGFSYYKRPWLANNPSSKTGMGIGAFNLISKQAYEVLGTHEVIKMRPDDDLMLGMKIKQKGFRQRIVTAMNLIEVEWYGSLKEAFKGLEKNTFAGLHYRISMVLFAIAGTFISQVLPFATIFSPDKIISGLSLANILLLAIVYTIITKRMSAFSPLLFLVFPITALLFIYSIIRASILTLVRGGIVWRGTLYKLSELRGKH